MRALLTVLVAALAAVVAGCGATERATAERVAEAAQRTADTGSARVELGVRDGEKRFTLGGVVDFEASEALLTFSGTRFGERADGELRVVGETLYVRAPILSVFSGEASWIAVPLARGDVLEDLAPFPYVDPDELLSRLEAAAGEVSPLGERDIRGASAEGYRVELDLARLAGREGGDPDAATVPVEVWIDGEDRVRRVVLSYEGKEASVDFYDFGADVDAQAPPPGDVVDLTTLLETFTGKDG